MPDDSSPIDHVSLADAYALVTPDDNRKLYRRWAATYESEFVAENKYVIPRQVAMVFAEAATALGADFCGPVLDVGSGTGLVAEALAASPLARSTPFAIDGVDISPEMIAVASSKLRRDGSALYRTLIEADLTTSCAVTPEGYGGLLSAGTFTHGHLGPSALSGLIRFGRLGALFAIGINAEHYAERGFERCLDEEVGRGTIRDLQPREVEMYLPGSPHWGETAIVAVFRRAG